MAAGRIRFAIDPSTFGFRHFAHLVILRLRLEKLSSAQFQLALLGFRRAVHWPVLQNRADIPADGVHRGACDADGRADGL